MNERDFWTITAMEKCGGSFVKALANLAHRADPINLDVIKTSWKYLWGKYEEIGIELEKTAYKVIHR